MRCTGQHVAATADQQVWQRRVKFLCSSPVRLVRSMLNMCRTCSDALSSTCLPSEANRLVLLLLLPQLPLYLRQAGQLVPLQLKLSLQGTRLSWQTHSDQSLGALAEAHHMARHQADPPQLVAAAAASVAAQACLVCLQVLSVPSPPLPVSLLLCLALRLLSTGR